MDIHHAAFAEASRPSWTEAAADTAQLWSPPTPDDGVGHPDDGVTESPPLSITSAHALN